MNDKKITKLLCIGSNCIAVDNFSHVNIWNSQRLFNNRLYKILFKEKYESRVSTDFEKEKCYYTDKLFRFNQGIYIIHLKKIKEPLPECYSSSKLKRHEKEQVNQFFAGELKRKSDFNILT
jgi:hypothetical protein